MKSNVFILAALVMFITACQPESSEKQLESLKAELSELNDKIETLEEAIALENPNKDSIPKGTPVHVLKLKAQNFSNQINIQGKVDAEENITVSSQIPGTITRINVKVGNRVRRGQILAETDDKAIRQQINSLAVNLELAKQVYERQQGLWDLNIGTEMQLLQAKANKEGLESQMATLEEQLRMSKIVSPINGTIDAVNVKLGEVSSPGMPSIRVINFSKLKVVAEVAESYASSIKKGADVKIHFPDMNDSTIGEVRFVSRAVNAVTRTFRVEVAIQPNAKYYPNMVANLAITDYKTDKPIIVIPVKLIQKDEQNAAYVYTAEKGIAKKHLITVGKQFKGQSEIKSGLKENDLLIEEGYNTINEGDILKVNM